MAHFSSRPWMFLMLVSTIIQVGESRIDVVEMYKMDALGLLDDHRGHKGYVIDMLILYV